MKRLLFILAALPILLGSCDKDDSDLNPGTGGQTADGNIRFEIGFAPQGGTQSDKPQTKVATLPDFTSAWEDGDEIGLFACTAGGSLATSGNHIHNVKLTYNKTTGTWIPSESLWWPSSGGKLNFYAYYPYDVANSDPTNISFNVLSDQSGTTSGKSNHSLSDLLTAQIANKGKDDGAVSLTFRHAMAMIQVNILKEYKGMGPSAGLTVTLRGVKLGATLNFNAVDGTTPSSGVTVPTPNNDPTSITMCRLEQPTGADYETSYTYRALVPVQNIATGNSLFHFDHEGRQLLADGVLSTTLNMTAGRAEKFTRTLPASMIETATIPAGTFQMGSPSSEPNHRPNETQHQVTLTKAFYMSKYQVTNTQYAAFLNAKEVQYETGISNGWISGNGAKCTWGTNSGQIMVLTHTWGVKWDTDKWVAQTGYENHPIISVTWFGAKAYADWIGGSLPTEAQWEYACRAGTTTSFFFGEDENNMGSYGWSWENNTTNGEIYGTKAVGRKQTNNYGLYDMHGNVWEWCSDWYGTYGNGPDINPTGPATGLFRILRGGSWDFSAQNCRSAFRSNGLPDDASNFIGFRVAVVP